MKSYKKMTFGLQFNEADNNLKFLTFNAKLTQNLDVEKKGI